jgi:hypothetical protein
LAGVLKLAPPSSDRAKKMSPPCDPPEKTISCQSTNTCFAAAGETTILGSHENTRGLRETFTGRLSRGFPSLS